MNIAITNKELASADFAFPCSSQTKQMNIYVSLLDSAKSYLKTQKDVHSLVCLEKICLYLIANPEKIDKCIGKKFNDDRLTNWLPVIDNLTRNYDDINKIREYCNKTIKPDLDSEYFHTRSRPKVVLGNDYLEISLKVLYQVSSNYLSFNKKEAIKIGHDIPLVFSKLNREHKSILNRFYLNQFYSHHKKLKDLPKSLCGFLEKLSGKKGRGIIDLRYGIITRPEKYSCRTDPDFIIALGGKISGLLRGVSDEMISSALDVVSQYPVSQFDYKDYTFLSNKPSVYKR